MLSLFIYGPFLIAVICAYAITYYSEVMLAEIEAQTDLKSHMRFPRLNWNFPEVIRRHKELYPDSHIARRVRFLTRIFITCGVTSMAVMFFSVLLRSAFR